MTDNLKAPIKIMIAGGGTGGHLFPGIAVAEEFRTSMGAEVKFVITNKPITIEILESYNIPYRIITSRPLKGKRIWNRIATLLWYIPKGVCEARKVLKQEEADLVLGMGGYTSGPVGVAASTLGIPLVIHEQNAILGLTNRMLARRAARVFLSYPDVTGEVKAAKAIWSGNPIRSEFIGQDRAVRKAAPFSILVMGGSQGAHHINMQMLEALPLLQDCRAGLRIAHLTGTEDLEAVRRGYNDRGFEAEVLSFTKDVAEYMNQAHLVICRAGASTLAELTAMGRVGMLVPYPHAADQHQEKNGRFLSETQAAYLILNHELTGIRIAETIRELMADPKRLGLMEVKCRSLAHPQAAAQIVAGCRNLLLTGTKNYED